MPRTSTPIEAETMPKSGNPYMSNDYSEHTGQGHMTQDTCPGPEATDTPKEAKGKKGGSDGRADPGATGVAGF